jgi:hypothetical protein
MAAHSFWVFRIKYAKRLCYVWRCGNEFGMIFKAYSDLKHAILGVVIVIPSR